MVLCDGLGCDGFAWKYLAPYLRRAPPGAALALPGPRPLGAPHGPHAHGHGLHLRRPRRGDGRGRDGAGGHLRPLHGRAGGAGVPPPLRPSRVQGLVLVCGSYGNPLDTFHDSTLLKRVFPFMRQLVERFPAAPRALVHALLSTELAMQVALRLELNRDLLSRERPRPLLRAPGQHGPRGLRADAGLAGRTTPRGTTCPHVDVPTLVVAGEQDKFTPPGCPGRWPSASPAPS